MLNSFKNAQSFRDLGSLFANDHDVVAHKIRPISNTCEKKEVADATSKYIISAKNNLDYVLIISSDTNPRTVQIAVENIRKIKPLMTSETNSPIAEPLYEGQFQGLSYATWLRHTTFHESRYRRATRKPFLVPKVFHWLQKVNSETFKSDLPISQLQSGFHDPLLYVGSNTSMLPAIRRIAQIALAQLENETWRPTQIAQHSDFWMGNVLLQNKRNDKTFNPHGFVVIDWGGAKVNGYPFIDLARFAMSANTKRHVFANEVSRHANIIGCNRIEVLFYVASALGDLGLNLDCFPEQRYLLLCEQIFDFFSNAGFEFSETLSGDNKF